MQVHRRPLAEALEDPALTGALDPVDGGVVELGYTVFPAHRGLGLATEAAAAVTRWALSTGEVGAVVATVAVDNVASLAVLARVGGFDEMGTCRDEDGGVERVFLRRR